MRTILWLRTVPLLVISATAQAYIDPNSGGLLFQILTPILIAIAAGWHWIRNGVVRAFRSIRTWASFRGRK